MSAVSPLEPSVCLGCLVFPGCCEEPWPCPSRLVQMAVAGRVRSSLANGRWQGAAASPLPSSSSPLLGGRSASHQAQDMAAQLDSFSGSHQRCGSAQLQTSAPCWGPSRWSWVLWKFPSLWRSVSLVLVWMWVSRLRALLLSPCRQNPQCWSLQLVLAAEGSPSVQREKPSALTHCSTTSYFWQKPAQADSEGLGRTENLQWGAGVDAEGMWHQTMLRVVISR